MRDAREILLLRFPPKDVLAPHELAFDEGEALREVTADAGLSALLPEHRLFRTRLVTSYDEYPFVDVIVAIQVDDVRVLLSPTFQPESPEFLELFHGLRAPEGDARKTLTRGIGELLQSLTHEGSLEEMEAEPDRSVWNLFRGNVSQNLLVFEFDDRDELVAVRVQRGSGVR